MTIDGGAGGSNPAEIPPAAPVNQADTPPDTYTILLMRLNDQASVLGSISSQLNWLCQMVNAAFQSMPPFMRGAVNVPTPNPGPGFPGQPTPYPGQH